MRTTVDIDADVLEVIKDLANHRRQSMGKVISDLCRKNLRNSGASAIRNGLRVIERPGEAAPVSLEVVNRLRDEIC